MEVLTLQRPGLQLSFDYTAVLASDAYDEAGSALKGLNWRMDMRIRGYFISFIESEHPVDM